MEAGQLSLLLEVELEPRLGVLLRKETRALVKRAGTSTPHPPQSAHSWPRGSKASAAPCRHT